MKLKLIILLIALSIFQTFGTPAKFYSVNSLFGISVRTTNSICKDHNGFIWASSKTGILRLTDDDYRIYPLLYETAGAIIVRLAYENEQLIAYTNNGQIFSYNPISDRFDLILNLRNYLDNTYFDVYKLLIDKSGRLWIALNNGIYTYSHDTLNFTGDISENRYTIEWYDREHILIASGRGIWLYNIEDNEKTVLNSGNNLPGFSVSSVYIDKKNDNLWIGTMASGLFKYDFHTSDLLPVLNHIIPAQPILAIEEVSDTTLFIGIDGQGLWEIDNNGTTLLNVYKENDEDPHSLKGNGVYDIFHEHGKRVWVGTISGGVSFHELSYPFVTQIAHQPNNPNSLVNNEVNGILEDSKGKLWFATDNGISCWDVETGIWKSYYSNKLEQAQVFLTLWEDKQGRIWAGSYSSGFYVIDAETGAELGHYSRSNSGLGTISNYIFAIFEDSDGDLWIGGVNGDFLCFIQDENRFITYFDQPVSSFGEYKPGYILVGLSYGLAMLNKSTGVMETLLSEIVVQDIVVDGETIWIGTGGEGLIEYNIQNGEIVKYNSLTGLPSDFINSIVSSGEYLWLGTENGLCRFNVDDKTMITFPSIFLLSGISYNKSSGLKLENGQLAWGTNHGVIMFYPESLGNFSSEGRIFLQDILISGQSIREINDFNLLSPVDELTTLSLRYFQNTINIELLPLGIPSGSKFSWKLAGFDKEWNPSTGNRIITYTNIPSGNFNLMIRLLDNSMTEILSERAISIRIIPPYWRKSWFWGLLAVILMGILAMYLLLYINKLKQRHTEEKIRFFTNTAHDIRTSLTLIKAPVEELSRETNLSVAGTNFLKLAIDQTRQLTSVITQLMDFQKVDIGKEHLAFSETDIVKLVKTRILMFKSVADNKNISFKVNIQCDQKITNIDEPKIEKVVDNLISNAIKYSPRGSQVQFELSCDKTRWTFLVKDQGIGISRKAQKKLFREFYRGENAINSKVVGSGIGLLLAKKYIAMHGGEISCESQENIGSTFKIEIPFKAMPPKKHKDVVPDKVLFETPSSDVEAMQDLIPKATPAKEIKILIVEDHDDLLQFMKATLENEFNVGIAEDGNVAWKYIQKHLPDLVVSDIMMPGMDGFELCRLIKSTYETSHVPIILLTALSEQSNQLHGLGLGADDYLTKPFEINLLVQKIKSIIHNREIVKEKALKLVGASPEEPLLKNELNDKFVKRVLEVARENIPNANFGKEEFASAMNSSTSLLYKKMKSLTNLSPSEFMKTIRLNHAMELLQSRKYSVTEVSELCGFTSVGYFSTVFKKYFKKSPTEI